MLPALMAAAMASQPQVVRGAALKDALRPILEAQATEGSQYLVDNQLNAVMRFFLERPDLVLMFYAEHFKLDYAPKALVPAGDSGEWRETDAWIPFV